MCTLVYLARKKGMVINQYHPLFCEKDHSVKHSEGSDN